jgi:tetratricopeptide (TPR) repeat protein
MAHKGKQHGQESGPLAPTFTLEQMAEQSQIDFELEFFGRILTCFPDYVDVLRVMGNNLTLKGRIREGLDVHRRLVRLRPHDPLAHYNLASSYALFKRVDAAIQSLRKAIELGYRDFRYIRQDRDLDSIRNDPRYRQLLQEFENG